MSLPGLYGHVNRKMANTHPCPHDWPVSPIRLEKNVCAIISYLNENERKNPNIALLFAAFARNPQLRL